MDKALTPYVKGGGECPAASSALTTTTSSTSPPPPPSSAGAKRYEQELKSMYGFEETGAVGGFQAMTQDMLTVLNDIPFSIPPYDGTRLGRGASPAHPQRRSSPPAPPATGTLR